MDLNTILYGAGQPAPVPPQTVLPQAQTPMPAPAQAQTPTLEAPTQTPLAPEQAQVMQQEGISGNGSGQGFFDKLRSDPALHQAMLMMGARLMQGPKQGQNELGVLGDATAVAAQVHNMLQTNERTMQTDEAKAGALINRENAGAEAVRGREARDAELHPQFKEKLNAEVKRLRSEGRKEEALALIAEAKADPKYVQQLLGLDLQVKQSQVNENNAQAGAASASAAASRANAEFTGERTKSAKTLNEQGSPDAVLHGVKSGAAGAKAKFAELETYVKAAHPDWDQSQVAQTILDMQTGRKGEDLDVLKIMAESDNKEHRKYATDQLAARAGYVAPGTAPKAGGQAAQAAPPVAQRVHGKQYLINGKTMTWHSQNGEQGWVAQ